MNLLKTNLLKVNKYNEIQGTNTIKHFPASTREWNNSVYVYNKNALDLIPVASLSVTKIIKSYFSLVNIEIEKKLRAGRLPIRIRKLSSNKIFIGNNEFKHTNNKVLINLYLFNRQKKNYIIILRKRYDAWKKYNRYNAKRHNKYKPKKYNNQNKYNKYKGTRYGRYDWRKRNKHSIVSKRKIYNKHKNNRKHKIRRYDKRKYGWARYNRKFIMRVNYIKYKIDLLLSKSKKMKHLMLKIMKKNKKSLKYHKFVNTYCRNLEIKLLKKLQLYFYYRQLIYINKSKFSYTYLQYLKKYLQNVYNKNIEFNLINLKRFYFNSDILSESMKLKLTKNRRRIFRHLNKLRDKVKIKKKSTLLLKPTYLNDNNLMLQKNTDMISIERRIIKNIKYKDVTGFRLEAKGRLTKRHTASRSVTKVRYKGNLLNIDSSYRGLSTVLLKGNLQSNLQYTKLKSKTRIGSFGLKGWVNAN